MLRIARLLFLIGSSLSVLAQSSSSRTSIDLSSTPLSSTSGLVSVTVSTPTSVPYFTISNTFTPPATGESPIPGSVITVANGPYLSDTFTYTAAQSTVQPTGNITNSNIPASRGGAGGSTGLVPDPTNLQTAAANRNSIITATVDRSVFGMGVMAVLGGLTAGVGMVI
ncbi:uncharacterized protein JCM15063_006234 [Sporobolomyces koalae]|uniref:uncharacterized protein n=1 Tax=Sporobolomyces koalae TaxID=500713 RepID=UPI003173752D